MARQHGRNFKTRRRVGPGGTGETARRCIVTRRSLPVERLLRFVVGPEGSVVPDIERKLPGRGLWLCARRDILHKACAGNLFATAARTPVEVTDGLPDQVERLLCRRCLDLIGLARRAGQAVAGYEKVRGQIRHGDVAVLLSASDGSPAERARMKSLSSGAQTIGMFSGAELGTVFGRDFAVHAAVTRGRLAERLVMEGERLAGFRNATDVRESN